MSSPTGVEVGGNDGTQSRAKWHESALAKLGLPNHQEPPRPVDVLYDKPTRLSYAKAEGVQDREDRPVCWSSQLATVGVGEPTREVEQALDVLGVEDHGRPQPAGPAPTRLDRRSVDDATDNQPTKQDSNYAEELVVAAR